MATTTAILSIVTLEKDGEKNIVKITKISIKINILIVCFKIQDSLQNYLNSFFFLKLANIKMPIPRSKTTK